MLSDWMRFCHAPAVVLMSSCEQPGVVRPVHCLASIFVTRKHLLEPLRHVVLRDSDLNLEEADLLVNLLGASEFNWADPPADKDGYVTFRDLRQSLVHTETLLSRRLAGLQKQGYVEVDMVARTVKRRDDASELASLADKDEGANRDHFLRLRGNSRVVRITSVGKQKIRPIWAAYEGLATQLLKDISKADLEAHYRVNKLIQDRVRPSWMRSAGRD